MLYPAQPLPLRLTCRLGGKQHLPASYVLLVSARTRSLRVRRGSESTHSSLFKPRTSERSTSAWKATLHTTSDPTCTSPQPSLALWTKLAVAFRYVPPQPLRSVTSMHVSLLHAKGTLKEVCLFRATLCTLQLILSCTADTETIMGR